MSAILDVVTAFFKAEEWEFTQIEDEPIVRLLYQGEHGRYVCYAQAREEEQQFVFYTLAPVNVPDEKRLAVAEFITRANYGLVVGNFELDFGDGELRYKTSIDVEDTELTPALVRPLVYANVWTLDRYVPGMMAVIYAEAEPADAIEKVEAD
jgi:hypothetical protein